MDVSDEWPVRSRGSLNHELKGQPFTSSENPPAFTGRRVFFCLTTGGTSSTHMERDLVIQKFGGTSVQDADALHRLVGIVAAEPRARIVVVSALAGVTDALCQLADGPPCNGSGAAALSRLRDRHLALASELVDEGRRPELERRLRELFEDATRCLAAGPPTPASRDALLAVGELASSQLVAEVLASAGLATAWVDARQVVVTDNGFGHARPDAEAIRRAAAGGLGPHVQAGRVPVVAGFIGAAGDGLTTTLGRGGSDYSASLVAAACGAAEVQIWTDVDGVLTADPRVVGEAALVGRLSFHEAYELARFGAKVLHWGTLEPAAASGIPVRVLNSRRPANEGTLIGAGAARAHAVAGLAQQTGVLVADVRARGVTGSRRFLDTALDWLEHHGRGLTTLSLSPSRVVVAAQDGAPVARFLEALEEAADARVQRDAALVAVVGDGLAARADAWRMLSLALDVGDVSSVVAPPSGDVLVCVTTPASAAGVMRQLHQRLFPASVEAPAAAGHIAGGRL